MTIEFSDVHSQPDGLSPQMAWVIDHAVEQREPLVANGDLSVTYARHRCATAVAGYTYATAMMEKMEMGVG